LEQGEGLLELVVVGAAEFEACRRGVVFLLRRLVAALGLVDRLAQQLVGRGDAAVAVLVVFQMVFQIRLAQSQTRTAAVGAFLDDGVGSDALGLDRAAARRVVARRGQLDRGAAGNRQ